MQLEYAFYSKSTVCTSDQATIVANMTLPTGSINKSPQTGFGAPSFFVGATYFKYWVDWFAFTGQGGIITTKARKTKMGDQFLYQWGLGRGFAYPKGWIFAWMCELDGQYYKKNRVDGKWDGNSGGNIIYLTPSIWISSETMLFQLGFSIPVTQNWFGRQAKIDYGINFNYAWTFD